MPVLNGRELLRRSLPPLSSRVGRDVLELIVVDDGSADDSGRVAGDLGARVVRNEARKGPSAARNRGSEEATGEILFFVDADVVVHEDAVPRVLDALSDESLDAVFGSYDDRPDARNFASLYMNLRHHHIHQSSAGGVSTFWAGCGAVRAEVFRRVGGFDAERFPLPSIEDVEFGCRVTGSGGRILLSPDLQGTHLKRWTLRDVVRTDIGRRAVPWGRLLAAGGGPSTELNMAAHERVCAGVAWAFVGCLGLWALGAVPFAVAAGCLLLAGWLNRRLLGVFARRGGWLFAAAGLLQHQLYYLYATLTFAYCLVEQWLRSQAGSAAT